MNDKKLADKIVALGIGGHTDNQTGDGKHYYEMRKHEHGVWVFDYMLETSLFVRDPRVAMAMMERMVAGEFLIWRQAYDDDSPVWIVETHLENADGRDESLPRAINEACVEALT